MPRSTGRRVLALLLAGGVAVAAVTLLGPERDDAAAGGPIPESPATTTSAPATGLHPGLQRALADAVAAARAAGRTLTVTSGFRTFEEQARLLAEAIEEHGSEAEALRWVFPPERSMHVKGLAVDVGDGEAADWLDGNGAAFGLCRTLAWEWWHFEWRESWETSRSCPDPVDDPDAATGAVSRSAVSPLPTSRSR